jgi:hypothetical protein
MKRSGACLAWSENKFLDLHESSHHSTHNSARKTPGTGGCSGDVLTELSRVRPLGFVAHHRTLTPGLPTALRCRFREEDDWPDDLVIVLDGINMCRNYAHFYF